MYFKSLNFKIISWIGKTALSNYIFQSILMGLLFYGYGFDLYNQFSRSQLVLWVLLIWTLQITATYIWLQYNRQGPLEALWRRLTYKPFNKS